MQRYDSDALDNEKTPTNKDRLCETINEGWELEPTFSCSYILLSDKLAHSDQLIFCIQQSNHVNTTWYINH